MFVKIQYVLDESEEACKATVKRILGSMTKEDIELAMSDEFAYLDDDTED